MDFDLYELTSIKWSSLLYPGPIIFAPDLESFIRLIIPKHMKISHFLWLTLISISLTIVACKDKKEDATSEPQSTEGQMTTPDGTVAADPAAGMPASGGQATSGTEAHYKCTTAGCTGSGAAQGKCPVCGADLVHNQAFHAQSAGTPGSTPDKALQVTPQGTTATPPPTTAVAQNAKGEYHYKCAKGHPGAANAGNCGTCGEPLTHNQAFHAN